MKGVINNYRGSYKTKKLNQAVVSAEGVGDREKAKALIGKKVVITYSKEKFVGKITSTHGNNGCLRVRFGRGIPGQVLGKEVEIL